MNVKLFTAATLQEAMLQAKNELGRDAVILHTRRFRKGGFLGFFSTEMAEVMAAVEVKQTKAVEKPQPDLTSLQLEMARMRKTLDQVAAKIPDDENQTSPALAYLLQNDIDLQIAKNLLQGLPEDQLDIEKDPEYFRRLLLKKVSGHLQKVDGITIPKSGCKTVALIGPTGVGKTTTIAKLAASFALKEGYKVALITADTYRIAAVEQLKTYGDILGIPVDIVYDPDELKAALFRHQDKNLVLIDTAGRSPRNKVQLEELRTILNVDPYIEIHLVLSVTTKYRDALEIINRFSACSPQKLLFTKLDEAANMGTILNLLYRFPTTLSYITMGQNVPDDIELANPNKLANLILRGSYARSG